MAHAALHKEIRLRDAVALYVSSVLGSGVLVLPGLTAQLAGPASLVAWAVLGFASYPFAYTFVSLSARSPKSGGVYSPSRARRSDCASRPCRAGSSCSGT